MFIRCECRWGEFSSTGEMRQGEELNTATVISAIKRLWWRWLWYGASGGRTTHGGVFWAIKRGKIPLATCIRTVRGIE